MNDGHHRGGIPIDTSTASVVLLAGHRVLLVQDPAGFPSHLSAEVQAGETAWQAVLRRTEDLPTIDVRSLYAAEYLEQYYDLPTNRVVICPAFVALVADDCAVDGGRWCSLSEALGLAPFPNQHALYRHVFEHFVDAEPEAWLRVDFGD